MHLQSYNKNLYLRLTTKLEEGLAKIQHFIDEVFDTEKFTDLEQLEHFYTQIFSDIEIRSHIEFGISRTHKVLYFREVEFDRSNSYYHLKLSIYSAELQWLDGIYGGVMTRVLKYYKALFSKIDNVFANRNEKQRDTYERIMFNAKAEILKLHEIEKTKDEINSEKRRLKDQHLSKIPFRSLFHITHRLNIPGILEKGILSHTKAYISQFFKKDISNQDINQRRSRPEAINNHPIHDYAPLYINPQNPMLESLCQRKNLRDDLILIKVSPNILVNSDVLFTDGNAAEEASNFYNNLDDFNKLNWEILSDDYYLHHPDGKRIKCSEVLVHDFIDLPYIDELVAFNEKNFDGLYDLFPNHMNITLKLDKDMFY